MCDTISPTPTRAVFKGGGGICPPLCHSRPPLASIGCSTSYKLRPPSFVCTPNLPPPPPPPPPPRQNFCIQPCQLTCVISLYSFILFASVSGTDTVATLSCQISFIQSQMSLVFQPHGFLRGSISYQCRTVNVQSVTTKDNLRHSLSSMKYHKFAELYLRKFYYCMAYRLVYIR